MTEQPQGIVPVTPPEDPEPLVPSPDPEGDTPPGAGDEYPVRPPSIPDE